MALRARRNCGHQHAAHGRGSVPASNAKTQVGWARRPEARTRSPVHSRRGVYGAPARLALQRWFEHPTFCSRGELALRRCGFTAEAGHLPERHPRQAQWTPESFIARGARSGATCCKPARRATSAWQACRPRSWWRAESPNLSKIAQAQEPRFILKCSDFFGLSNGCHGK